jgi:hypothetical protein
MSERLDMGLAMGDCPPTDFRRDFRHNATMWNSLHAQE